jgi:isopenicillin N synthase-like dioxygenase
VSDGFESGQAFPTLDLQQLTQRGPHLSEHLAELRTIAHGFGAFLLVGHGIEQRLADELLAVSRKLFALPQEQLARIAMIESPHFRGYNRVRNELTKGRADWREQIDIGPELPAHRFSAEDAPYWLLNGPNQWPAELPEFRVVILEWMRRAADVAQRLLGAFAESLDLSNDYFADAFAGSPHAHLKVIRYPGGVPDPDRQGVGAHKDYGFLTLLTQDGVGGLQFLHDGVFVDVPARRGAFVVNIGEMLEVATGGYLTATTHRVVSPPDGAERISIPYFYNPRLDYLVQKIPLPAGIRTQSAGVADPDNPIFAEYGRNALKGWLRAHPVVAQRHHPALRP